MFEFFKRSYLHLDMDEIIIITKAAFKKIKELESEIKLLNLKIEFFREALDRQNKLIKMLENEKKSKLMKRTNIRQN